MGLDGVLRAVVLVLRFAGSVLLLIDWHINARWCYVEVFRRGGAAFTHDRAVFRLSTEVFGQSVGDTILQKNMFRRSGFY